MKKQSHIEQLIHDLCPNGVEYTTLGALGTFANTGVDKKIVPGEKSVTLLNFVDVFNHRYIDSSIPSMRVTASDKKIVQCNVLKNDIFVTPSSETRDEIGRAAVVTEDLKDTVYSYHIMRYRLNSPNTISARYIRYLFDSSIIQQQVEQNAQGLTRFGVSKFQFASFSIPFPPVPIQEEVVHILDSFDSLLGNINEEISVRQIQSTRAINRLLSDVNNEWEEKPIEEICENCDKKRRPITAQFRKKGIYPYYGASGIVDYVADYIYDGDYLLISEDGANLLARHTPIAFSISGKNWVNNHAHVLKFKQLCTQKFVEYYINSISIEAFVSGGTQPKLNQASLKTIPIPFPPIAEQQRIVAQLDTVKALIANLDEERDLRQQQFEHYREQLISLLK